VTSGDRPKEVNIPNERSYKSLAFGTSQAIVPDNPGQDKGQPLAFIILCKNLRSMLDRQHTVS
jgi:hypothetical protein